MKLLVIVLCLLSERYLIHSVSFKRFSWFPDYFNALIARLPANGFFGNAYIRMAVVILPPILITLIVLLSVKSILYGFVCFLVNLVVFYYTLGPSNPFYPVLEDGDASASSENNLSLVNGQLFAVVFWFILFGPLAALFYRLVALCSEIPETSEAGKRMMDLLDWIPARITVLLYLLAGNFQQGFSYFLKNFFTRPQNNEAMLRQGGLLAARVHDDEALTPVGAQSLIEHAVIIYIVFLACLTIVSWL